LIAQVPAGGEQGQFVDGQYARGRFAELYQLANDPGRRRKLRERLNDSATLNPLQRTLLDIAVEWIDDEIAEGTYVFGDQPTLEDLIARLKVPACTIARTSAFLIDWASR
jgi:glutathione S-transferase